MQIDEKYRIFKRGQTVVDLVCCFSHCNLRFRGSLPVAFARGMRQALGRK